MLFCFVVFIFTDAASFRSFVHSDVQHKVKCTTAEMTVEMMLPDSVTDVYLEGMKEYGKEVGMMPMHFLYFFFFF